MWDSMVTLLSASLIGKYFSLENGVNSHVKLRKLLPRKTRFSSKKEKARDNCITLSLEGLHKVKFLNINMKYL